MTRGVALALLACAKSELGRNLRPRATARRVGRIGGRPSTSMVGCKHDALRVWAELRVRRQAARRVEELAQAAAVRVDLARRVTPSSGTRHVEQMTTGGMVQVRGHAARRLPPSRQSVGNTNIYKHASVQGGWQRSTDRAQATAAQADVTCRSPPPYGVGVESSTEDQCIRCS